MGCHSVCLCVYVLCFVFGTILVLGEEASSLLCVLFCCSGTHCFPRILFWCACVVFCSHIVVLGLICGIFITIIPRNILITSPEAFVVLLVLCYGFVSCCIVYWGRDGY